jgi:HEAT repeat protein
MKKNHVIKFDSKERILKTARSYVESVESFLDESDRAIPLLIKAIKLADRDFKHEIMLLLGSFAKEAVVWPLYDLMTDSSESEEIRHDTAIQLSVIGSRLKNFQPLVDRLLQEIGSTDPQRRLHATFAIGWEGNFQAATSLIERLFDNDSEVQQTAVNALCNLREDRTLDLLLDRLAHGPFELKRIILFNLWRFHSKRERVAQVYIQSLGQEDPELRFVALVCLKPITDGGNYLDIYRKCLADQDSRIRALALNRLADEASESDLQSIRAEVDALLNDPDMRVKRADKNSQEDQRSMIIRETRIERVSILVASQRKDEKSPPMLSRINAAGSDCSCVPPKHRRPRSRRRWTINDAELVQRVLAGDGAFGHLIDRYWPVEAQH